MPKLRCGPGFGAQDAIQGLVPIQVVTAEGPIGREAYFEQFDVLFSGILEEFPGDPFEGPRGGDALLGDAEGLQHDIQTLPLIVDLDVRVQPFDIVGWQLQAVLSGDVDDRGCADGPFEMDVESRSWGSRYILGSKFFMRRLLMRRYRKHLLLSYTKGRRKARKAYNKTPNKIKIPSPKKERGRGRDPTPTLRTGAFLLAEMIQFINLAHHGVNPTATPTKPTACARKGKVG